ncbi:MAG: hypothetical protein ABJL67_02550 [Sulfitobacter sp.]
MRMNPRSCSVSNRPPMVLRRPDDTVDGLESGMGAEKVQIGRLFLVKKLTQM